MRRRISIVLVCLFAFFLTNPAFSQQDDTFPPIITIDNVTRVTPVYRFLMDRSIIGWVEGEPESDVTPTPELRQSYYGLEPIMHVSQDGRRAAIVTTLPDALWLVDLQAGTWQPFLLPIPPDRYSEDYPLSINISPDFTWLAIAGRWDITYDTAVRFWRLDSLYALGGIPLSSTPAEGCDVRIAVDSTTLRTAPRLDTAAMRYPLRDEVFRARAFTTDREWVQVTSDSGRGWLGADFVEAAESCTGNTPYLIDRGTETSTVPLPSYSRSMSFTNDSRYFGSIDNPQDPYPSDASNYSRGVLIIDPERGVVVYGNASTPKYGYGTDTNDTGLRLFGRDIFNLRTLKVVSTLADNITMTRVSALRFSPDEKYLLVISGAVGTLYDVQTGDKLKQVALLNDRDGFKWSPESRYVLFWSRDTAGAVEAFLWDTTHPEAEIFLNNSDAVTILPPVMSNSFYDTSMSFAAGDPQIILDISPAIIWDIATNGLTETDQTQDDRLYSVLLLPNHDGWLRSARGMDGAEAVNLSGEVLGTVEAETALWRFAGGGRWLVVLNRETMGISLLAAVGVGTESPTVASALTPTPTTRHIATPVLTPTATPAPTLALPPVIEKSTAADAITGDTIQDVRLLHVIEHPLPRDVYATAHMLGFSPDGRFYVTAGGNTLIFWSTETGERVREYALDPDVVITGVAVPTDFSRATILTNEDELLLVYLNDDGAMREVLRESIQSRTLDRPMLFSPDGTRLAVRQRRKDDKGHYTLADTTIRDGSTGAVLHTTGGGQSTTSMGFTTQNMFVQITDGFMRGYRGSEFGNLEAYIGQPSDLVLFEKLHIRVKVTGGVNLALIQEEEDAPFHLQEKPPYQVLQGHLCPIAGYRVSDIISPSVTLLASIDECGEVRFWNIISGVQLTATEAAHYLPHGINLVNTWIFANDSDEVIRWRGSILNEGTPYYGGGSRNRTELGPDFRTLTVFAGNHVALYGLPTEQRPAFQTVFAKVIPSTINVRKSPSFDAEVIGYASQGQVIVSGRDASGQFVYLPTYGGWVNAESAYIEILDATVQDLHVYDR